MKRAYRVVVPAVAAPILAVGVILGSEIAQALPISFTASDYDNTANTVGAGPTPVNNQTTGVFRDVFWWSINNGAPRVGSPDFINQGNSLALCGISACPGAGPYTALNFTGPSISGGQSYLAIYDTTPADGTATRNLFDASGGTHLQISTDILFVKHNASGGLVALYSGGQDGLALLANNGGGNNHDFPSVSLIFQSPGNEITLSSVNLAANSFVPLNWYRVTMDLTVSGDSWTVTGHYFNHSDPTNPNSALGAEIDTNPATVPVDFLTFTGSLSNPDASARVLTNPGEIGLVAMGNESISLPDNVGVSFTNFNYEQVPEPGTLALLGGALLGLGMIRRRRRAATA